MIDLKARCKFYRNVSCLQGEKYSFVVVFSESNDFEFLVKEVLGPFEYFAHNVDQFEHNFNSYSSRMDYKSYGLTTIDDFLLREDVLFLDKNGKIYTHKNFCKSLKIKVIRK